MDFDEWEFLPDDEILDYQSHGEKKFTVGRRSSALKSVLNMDYFAVESPETNSRPSNSRAVPPSQLVPIPFELEPKTCGALEKDGDQPPDQIITKVPIGVPIVGSAIPEKIRPPLVEADLDGKSRVFFKKTNNNEFVDMSVTSPRSSTKGFVPQFDAGVFNFEEKNEAFETCRSTSPRKSELVSKQTDPKNQGEGTWEENSGGLNLWKWSLTGIGAICSFGVAAATICIIIFGAQHSNKQQKQNQKLRLQIYADDKIKQVVHHATKLNEAISAARGVPFNRAHISFGGYYEGL